MAEQNYTIWQRLTQAFGPNSLLNQDYPSIKFDNIDRILTREVEIMKQYLVTKRPK